MAALRDVCLVAAALVIVMVSGHQAAATVADTDLLDKQKMRILLRGVNLKGTQLEYLVTPDDTLPKNGQTEPPSWSEVFRLLENNPDIVDRLKVKMEEAESGGFSRSPPTPTYEECRKDYSTFVEPITSRLVNLITGQGLPVPNATRWGARMFDATAKLPAGLTTGGLHWIGAFDLCRGINATYNYTIDPNTAEQRNVQGQYCRLEFKRSEGLLSAFPWRYGSCVPASCTEEEIEYYILYDNPLLAFVINETLGVTLAKVFCGKDLDPDNDPLLDSVKVVIPMSLAIYFIITLYDGLYRKKLMRKKMEALLQLKRTPGATGKQEQAMPGAGLSRQTSTSSRLGLVGEGVDMDGRAEDDVDLKPTFLDRLEVFLVSASFYSNVGRIWRTTPEPGQLAVLNGLRVLSFGYTIYGHAWLYGPLYSGVWPHTNLVNALAEYPSKWSFQPVINFHFCSDTFFTISGFLVAYWWLKKYEETQRITAVGMFKYYFHRWWRIAPTFVVTMWVYVALGRYGYSPCSAAEVGDMANCAETWWVNMLLLHNVVKTQEQCMAPQWYLSAIWQLHIVTPIILIPLVIKPLYGYISLGVMMVLHLSITAGISAGIYDPNAVTLWDWYIDVFNATWCRAGPYFVGIAAGIFMYQRQCKITMHPLVVACGWATTAVLLLAPAYSTYGMFREGGELWGQVDWVFYDTFARTGWGLGIAWIIVACHCGYGGVVGELLSWRAWQPLSKLVFCSFLLHILITFIRIYGLPFLLYINQFNLMYSALSNTIIFFTAGFLLPALIFQYPVSVGWEKAFTVTSKWDCIFVGQHPDIKEVAGEQQVTDFHTKSPVTVKGQIDDSSDAFSQL